MAGGGALPRRLTHHPARDRESAKTGRLLLRQIGQGHPETPVPHAYRTFARATRLRLIIPPAMPRMIPTQSSPMSGKGAFRALGFHCFTASADFRRKVLALGGVSFPLSGIVNFNKCKDLQEVAKIIPEICLPVEPTVLFGAGATPGRVANRPLSRYRGVCCLNLRGTDADRLRP